MQLFESSEVNVLHFYLWGWMNNKVYNRKLDTRDELLARVLDAAACVKRREDEQKTNNTRSSNTICKVH